MNKQEFSRRVLAVENKLYRISCGMLQNPQDRMDAVQEAVIRAWSNICRLRQPEYFETWLTRILINECHNIQKNCKNIVSLDNLPERGAYEGNNKPLQDAILALDMQLRLPVLLFYTEGTSCVRSL